MQIIPVIDLLDGHVVRGVAGRRESYAPIESFLSRTAEPLDVARGIRDTFGLHRLYIADLNAILQDAPQWPTFDELVEDGFQLMVDAGLREPKRARQLVDRGVTQVIAALETLPDCMALFEIVRHVGAERVVFSLDLMQGKPMGNLHGWEAEDPLSVFDWAVATGVTSVIVLDLSGVGVGQGVPTLGLCRQLAAAHPDLRLITGGGVRDDEDVQCASETGIDGLLVASALHDGAITPTEVARRLT